MPYEYSDTELLLGKINIERGGELFLRTVERFISIFEQRLRGKKTADGDTSEEERMLNSLKELR